MTGVLIKGGNLDTESGMHPGKMPYEDEGRDGVMPVQAMECQGVPAIYQNLPAIYLSCGRGLDHAPLQLSEGTILWQLNLRLLSIRL